MTIVRTTAGDIKGYEKDGIHHFKGVPFAAPPVGDLRFAPPQPPAPWEGTRDATEDGPICPQAVLPLEGPLADVISATQPQDEDCLTLTVATPSVDSSLPVMVWIHGGAFTGGSGSTPIYDGATFAARRRRVRVDQLPARTPSASSTSTSCSTATHGHRQPRHPRSGRRARMGARQHRRVRRRSRQRDDLRRVGRRHERRHAHGHAQRQRPLPARHPPIGGGKPQHQARDRDTGSRSGCSSCSTSSPATGPRCVRCQCSASSR